MESMTESTKQAIELLEQASKNIMDAARELESIHPVYTQRLAGKPSDRYDVIVLDMIRNVITDLEWAWAWKPTRKDD